MSTEMDNLNADIDRLIAEANAERDDAEENSNDNNNDDNDNSGNESNDDNNSADDNSDSKEQGNSKDEEGSENGQSSDDNGSGQEESTKDKEENFSEIKTKVDGQEITLENKEEVEQFIANQNRNIQSQRPSVVDEIVTQAKISQNELQLMADVKAGKPGALKALANLGNIDLADADEFEGEYKPEFEPVIKNEIDIVLDGIRSNTELAPKFNEVIKTLPDDFIEAVGSNANDLQKFAGHIDSGLAQELLPQAIKMTSLGQGTLFENYLKVGNAKFAKENGEQKQEPKKEERHISKKEKELRDRASSDADKNKGGKSSDLSVDDLWAEDDLLSKVRSGEIDLRNLD